MTASTADLAIGSICQALLGSALFTAAMLKASSIRELKGTLVALGLPAKAAQSLAWVVVGAEAAAGITLIALPEAAWPRVFTAFLALAFASIGIRALAARRRIACGCFGSLGRRNLGWIQVLALPMWLGLCVMAQLHPPRWSWEQGLLGLTALVGALLVWQSVREVRVWSALRGDRIAINEAVASMNGQAEQLRRSAV
jgi:hypothetical protein